MDIQLLFDKDTLVLMSLEIPAYGGYNLELLTALSREFEFRYGPPVDSLMNYKFPNPNFTNNIHIWSTSFCKQQKIIRIHQFVDLREKVGESLLIEFVSDRFIIN